VYRNKIRNVKAGTHCCNPTVVARYYSTQSQTLSDRLQWSFLA